MDTLTGDTNTPINTLIEQETDVLYLKTGSLMSILKNEHINNIKYVIYLLSEESIKKAILHIFDIENTQPLIYYINTKYPNLYKSKTLTHKLKNIKNVYKRKRKKIV